MIGSRPFGTALEIDYRRTPAAETELGRLVTAEHECCLADAVSWELAERAERLTVTVRFGTDFVDTAEAEIIRRVLLGG